jgi:hypothetical protein
MIDITRPPAIDDKNIASELIPEESLILYEGMAAEYLEELLEEYLDAEEIDLNKLDIQITISTRITKK